MRRTVKGILAGSLLSWSMVGAVQAATVTFSDIIDGDGSASLFDVSATVPDPGDGNKLIIGLNDFSADGTSVTTALDTLTLTINADPGFLITSISYTETGVGSTTEGVAAATGSIVVDNKPTNFVTQLFSPNSSSGWSITPSLAVSGNKTSINISITNSLFAVAFPGGIAEIAKSSATLTIGTQPVPLPPAVWLFGSVLAGFVAFSRRRLS